jgi:hypothetical protein
MRKLGARKPRKTQRRDPEEADSPEPDRSVRGRAPETPQHDRFAPHKTIAVAVQPIGTGIRSKPTEIAADSRGVSVTKVRARPRCFRTERRMWTGDHRIGARRHGITSWACRTSRSDNPIARPATKSPGEGFHLAVAQQDRTVEVSRTTGRLARLAVGSIYRSGGAVCPSGEKFRDGEFARAWVSGAETRGARPHTSRAASFTTPSNGSAGRPEILPRHRTLVPFG